MLHDRVPVHPTGLLKPGFQVCDDLQHRFLSCASSSAIRKAGDDQWQDLHEMTMEAVHSDVMPETRFHVQRVTVSLSIDMGF